MERFYWRILQIHDLHVKHFNAHYSTYTLKHYCFDTRYKVEISTREYWKEVSPPLNNGNIIVWYTELTALEWRITQVWKFLDRTLRSLKDLENA
jgi:hypothetical protein